MRAGVARAVRVGELAQPGGRGIDVIELVDDRVELGDPRLGAAVELGFPGSFERLLAEARQHERDEVFDAGGADAHFRRLGDEPFGAAGQLAGRAVLPEVVAGLGFRQRQTVTGGKRPFGVGPSEAAEHQHLAHVDEAERGCTRHDVLHQERDALCVIDHTDTLLARDGASPTLEAEPAAGR